MKPTLSFKPQRGKFTPLRNSKSTPRNFGFKPQRGKFTHLKKLGEKRERICFKPQRGKFTLYDFATPFRVR